MGAYRGHSPNFLDVVRRLFRGGPPNKCQGAKMYPRTKRGDTVNYQLARTRLLGHTSVQCYGLPIDKLLFTLGRISERWFSSLYFQASVVAGHQRLFRISGATVSFSEVISGTQPATFRRKRPQHPGTPYILNSYTAC